MWAPVGPREAQSITVYEKDSEGNVTNRTIMDVRYGSLTSVED